MINLWSVLSGSVVGIILFRRFGVGFALSCMYSPGLAPVVDPASMEFCDIKITMTI